MRQRFLKHLPLKVLIATVYALSVFFVFTVDFLPTIRAATETRKLLFIEAQQRHSDVWANCNQACIDDRLAGAPFLRGLAIRADVDLNDLVRYAVVRSYEWGLNFEALYGRPPTEYDWIYAYADNAEALRYELDTSPNVFIVNFWAGNHQFTLNGAYE